jgi:glycosyltransferase involved in cell wall biosynthesis
MKKYTILIPVFNDWESASQLIKNIDLEISKENSEISVIIVNDNSTEKMSVKDLNISNLKSVEILNLLKNGGHCHAIATGIKYINEKVDFDYIVPMDGDGEDRPEELKKIFELAETSSPEIITANRVERSEGPLFQFCYQIHKILTYLMIGKIVKFGNYSCLSKQAVMKMLSNGSLWLSYSGSVVKNFSSISHINSIRGKRYFGPSKMNFSKLVVHSLSISAAFREIIFIRSTLLVMFFSYAAHATASSYFLIPAMLSWIFMLFIFYLSRNDDLKKLDASSSNIKDLTTFYKR